MKNNTSLRPEHIETRLLIYMIIAWRVFYLTKLKETPDVPCGVFFEEYERKVLIFFPAGELIADQHERGDLHYRSVGQVS